MTSNESDPLAPYFSGERLYGDEFSLQQIREWYEAEKEGYADLGAKDSAVYTYAYHAFNALHGFRYLPERRFSRALGIGSAYGDEFAPIADRVDEVTILEPSDAFVKDDVHGIPARWVKPGTDGTLPFEDHSFDLVTCLGVLHHIPNVTHVVNEIHRCMRPDGWALVREPVVSMGDWRHPRPGLTKRERGIPVSIFRDTLRDAGFHVVHEAPCVFPLVPKLWHVFGREAFNSRLGTRLDGVLSRILRPNLRYHADTFGKKFRPVAVYCVLTR
jgi:SAM-dependent methyltransferase